MNTQENDLVLIVDDNALNIQVIANLLEENNYDIAVATNGREALEFLTEDQPELILLDIMMPDIDGYEVCRRIKRHKNYQKIPIIFLTAKATTEDLVEGFSVGAVDYVTKPFESLELLARVRTHIELKKARESIKTLSGLIPICACCKKIRDDQDFWQTLETYLAEHSDATFTHGYCPECARAEKERVREYMRTKNRHSYPPVPPR